MESSATVTISRAYFDTLIRRCNFVGNQPSASLLPSDLASTSINDGTILVLKPEYDDLKAVARHYANLCSNLINGGATQATLDLLSSEESLRQDETLKPKADAASRPRHAQYAKTAIRTVVLYDLAETTTHADITDVVRGGMLLEVLIKIHDRSAQISFLHAESAQAFYNHVRRHDLYIRQKRTNSVYNAMFARTCMMSRYKYKGSKVEWDADGCTAPLESLVVSKTQARAAAAWSKVELTAMANRFHILDPGGLSSEDTDETDTFASQP
ncbi:hypothetical protein HYQ45_012042 [Verticillium longisporum]|uniref:RRM domain-containing protein n=1 Tax=Verticillium longisporum TaxID=100787 RepID=A0A8I2ZEN6_VERLO|nr:hypothetical protein HYQ45_012042 [Verticillium longisporum]